VLSKPISGKKEKLAWEAVSGKKKTEGGRKKEREKMKCKRQEWFAKGKASHFKQENQRSNARKIFHQTGFTQMARQWGDRSREGGSQGKKAEILEAKRTKYFSAMRTIPARFSRKS